MILWPLIIFLWGNMSQNKQTIVGREEEKDKLNKILHSSQAEFLAIYGRRRVGKTFLIKEFFKQNECVLFRITGVKKGLLHEHLNEFKKAVEQAFYPPHTTLQTPKSWMQAFEMLNNALNAQSYNKPIILFFDELPWLATKRS